MGAMFGHKKVRGMVGDVIKKKSNKTKGLISDRVDQAKDTRDKLVGGAKEARGSLIR